MYFQLFGEVKIVTIVRKIWRLKYQIIFDKDK